MTHFILEEMRLHFEIKFLCLRLYFAFSTEPIFCSNVTDLRCLPFVVTGNLETFS